MKKSNREQLILKKIEETGFMRVDELARLMYTSPSSIRRDLASLENQKLITRTYGGAKPSININTLTPFDSRQNMNLAQKRRAAQNAAFLLHDSMSVMLDNSSTAMQMLSFIKPFRNIKVLTSNVSTFLEGVSLGLDIHLLGGTPSADIATLAGDIAEDSVRKFFPDILFFSSKCIATNGDISDPIENESRLRKVMLEHARMRVFLYDSGKLGTVSLHRLCNVRDIDYSFCEDDEQNQKFNRKK